MRRPSHCPQRYPYVNPSVHCKTLPCIDAEESNFTPLSRRTQLNILSVCSASTRKSLQGLDYISSAGAQAFQDLTDVAKCLGDHLMGMTWAKEQRERLMSAKRYLKSDYKVRRY